LSAWYSLRDIERLVAETCDRIDMGMSTETSVLEAGFAFDDIVFALEGSQISPMPHESHPGKAMSLKRKLERAAQMEDKHSLSSVHRTAQKMRDRIATTTQEGPRATVCR
jgi:hypothetical protein